MRTLISLITFFVIHVTLFAETKIALFGDSNTYGWKVGQEEKWANQLAVSLDKNNVKISNFAQCAAYSWLIDEIHQKTLEKEFFDIVVINAGLVDAMYWKPAHEIKANLIKIIERSLEQGSVVIFGQIELVSWVHTLGYYTIPYLKEVDEIYKTLPNEYPIIPFVFLDSEILIADQIGDYVHPNAVGHRKIYERIREKILEVLSDQKKE